MIDSSTPSILMSIWMAVTPSLVPATLKSMSPRWSSSPRMSESTATREPSFTRPIARRAPRFAVGTAGALHAHRAGENRAHGGGAVRLERLAHEADRVRELFLIRQH